MIMEIGLCDMVFMKTLNDRKQQNQIVKWKKINERLS